MVELIKVRVGKGSSIDYRHCSCSLGLEYSQGGRGKDIACAKLLGLIYICWGLSRLIRHLEYWASGVLPWCGLYLEFSKQSPLHGHEPSANHTRLVLINQRSIYFLVMPVFSLRIALRSADGYGFFRLAMSQRLSMRMALAEKVGGLPPFLLCSSRRR